MPDTDVRLYSTQEIADAIDLSIQRVKQIRAAWAKQGIAVGRLVGRNLVFTEDELRMFRERPKGEPGRPRTKQRAHPEG